MAAAGSSDYEYLSSEEWQRSVQTYNHNIGNEIDAIARRAVELIVSSAAGPAAWEGYERTSEEATAEPETFSAPANGLALSTKKSRKRALPERGVTCAVCTSSAPPQRKQDALSSPHTASDPLITNLRQIPRPLPLQLSITNI